MLNGARRPEARLIWANNHLLFWMSLIPFGTAYMSTHSFEPIPVATYGAIMAFMSASFTHLRLAILKQRFANCDDVSKVHHRMQLKNTFSSFGYFAAIGFAFINVWISYALFLAIPASYFLPDRSFVVEQEPAE
jgi:uncharacterized membrane protein